MNEIQAEDLKLRECIGELLILYFIKLEKALDEFEKNTIYFIRILEVE